MSLETDKMREDIREVMIRNGITGDKLEVLVHSALVTSLSRIQGQIYRNMELFCDCKLEDHRQDCYYSKLMLKYSQ